MIRFALIGSGKWGKNYINTLLTIGKCQLKYVCSPNIEKKQEVKGNFLKIKNYKELLDKKDIDGVIIASPASTHFQIASDFIKKDINLLIEKPFVVSLKDAKVLSELIKNSNSKVLVGHIYSYNSGFQTAKNLIKKIGNIKSANFKNFSDGPVRWDVSDLWDRAYHDFYIFQNLFENKPKEIICITKDLAIDKKIIQITLFLDKGIKIILESSSSYNKKVRSLKIIGTKGSIRVNDIKKTIELTKNNTIFTKKYKDNPLRSEILDFIRIIKSNDKPSLSPVLECVKLLDLAERSLKSNKLLKYED